MLLPLCTMELLILLPLLLSYASALSPSPSPIAAPKRSPPTHAVASAPSSLDPKQLSALQSMNLPTTRDPCSLTPPHNFTKCDSSSPFRHVTALTLTNCSADLDLSTTALRSLSSSLVSLSFRHCPIPPPHLPSSLLSTLKSFSSTSSLRRLTGVYLSRLANLTDLTVIDVPVNASGPWIILSRMDLLRSLTISGTTLSGELPRKWHQVGISHLDLSANELKGPIYASIGRLTKLEFLNLSSNSFTGTLPSTIANMVALKNASFAGNSLSGPVPDTITELPGLVHLDLSSNQFNGTLPRFLTQIKGLKYLNLENNNFHGVMPFNVSFIKRLDVFKVGGNSNLCYNHTLLSSKLKLGIALCDRYGMPVSPPPDRTSSSGSDSFSADDSGSSGSSDGGGHHGPNKIVLVVAIGLSCLVFLIIFLVCLSKMCG